MITAHQRVVF